MSRQGGIRWLTDLDAGLKQAGAENRLVVIHFWIEGRPLSETMMKETYAHPNVVRVSAREFVNVKLDSAGHPELFREIVGSRGGMGTGIVDETKDVISVLPGFAGAEAYVAFLHRALRGYGALAKVRASSKRRPRSAALLFALAEEYGRLGSRGRAKACYLGVLQRGEGAEETSSVVRRAVAYSQERLARLSALRGKNREARAYVADYRKRLVPGGVGREDRILVTEALACSIERKHSEAIRILGGAQIRFPGSPEADQMALLKGICLHESGEDAPALRALQAMVREFPRSRWLLEARTRIDHINNPPPGHRHPE